MGIVQGIDGSMLLNALRQGREDRAAVDDRALQRMFQQRQVERQDEIYAHEKKGWEKQDKVDEAYSKLFGATGAQPAGAGSTPPVAQPNDLPGAATQVFRPDPAALQALMALGPEGVKAATAIQSMSADQLKAAQEGAIKAMEIKGRVINSIRAVAPEKREAEYQAQKQQLAQQGVDVSHLAPHWDEDYADLLVKQSLTGAQALGLEQQAKTFAETVRHNKAGEANANAGLGIRKEALNLANRRENRVAAGGSSGGEDDSVDNLLSAAGL